MCGGYSRGVLGFAIFVLSFATAGASAQDGVALEYSLTDRATVRVMAVQGVRTETLQGRQYPRVVAIPVAGHGSGIVVSDNGIILTAKHVVEGATHIAVRLPGDGGVRPAEVVYQDETRDFAILAAHGSFESYVSLPETAPPLRARDTVDAIGYPLDATRSHPQSSRGILSGVLDNGDLQLGMSLNPGNSGGPLVTANEDLVGIVVARGDPERGVQGIGVAVPIQPIQTVLTRLKAERGFDTAWQRLEPASRSRSADVVDVLVQVGSSGQVLREVAQAMEHAQRGESLNQLRAIAQQVQDPRLMVLLSAYFWDAGIIALERAGYADPRQMPPGPQRELAHEMLSRATALARAAVDRDRRALQSQYVAYVTGFSGPPPTQRQQQQRRAAQRQAAPPVTRYMQPPARPAAAPTQETAGDLTVLNPQSQPYASQPQYGFRPLLLGSIGLDVRTQSFHLNVSAFFPLMSPQRERLRFAPILGASLGVGSNLWLGAEVGAAARFGKSGLFLFGTWAPGYFQDIAGDDITLGDGPSWLSFHAGAGFTANQKSIGLAFRFIHAPVDDSCFGCDRRWFVPISVMGTAWF